MQQLRVLFVYALILAAVVYGAIKAYVYFSVKGELDDAVARLQPFAQISYGGISSSLKGSIEVDGIEVKSAQQPVPMRIGSLRLQGDGPGFLFDAAKGFGGGNIPERLRISARRFELPDIQQMAPALLPEPDPLRPGPLPDECSLGRLLQDAGPLRSDSYPLYLDLDVGYEMSMLDQVGRMSFGYDAQGGESFSVTMKLSGIPRPGAVMMGAAPVIDRLSLVYRPNGEYLKRRVAECAKKHGSTSAIYVRGLLAQPDGRLGKELGFVPGKGLRGGVEQLLLKAGELQLTAGPIEEPMQLGSRELSPQRMMDLFNLQVSVDNEPITDLSFSDAAADDTDGGEMAADKKKSKRRARYIETPLGELGNYVGRPVKVSVAGHEKPHSGVLVGVGEDELDVEKRRREGRMNLHVSFKNIERVEVLRFPPQAE